MKIFLKTFFIVILCFFSVSVFASDVNPTQDVANGYLVLQPATTNFNWVRQQASFDFNAGDFENITLILESTGTANISVFGTCQYEGTAQFSANLDITTRGTYTFYGRTQNSHCYNTYWQVVNNSLTENVRIYGSLQAVSGVYLENYTGVLTSPNILALAYVVNNPPALILSPQITNISPAENSTVGAYFTISGTYTNDGTYDAIMYELFDDTNAGVDPIVAECQTALWGSNLAYNCSHRGQINTNYRITPYLYDRSYPFPFGSLPNGTNPSISFTTNDNFSVPPIGGQTCSTFDVGCYVVNGIQYLFYPSDIAGSKLNELIDTIKLKPPIGYVSGVLTGLGNIDINATPTLTFATFTPVSTYIFSPFRTGLVWVLWFTFMFLLFKRFQHLDI